MRPLFRCRACGARWPCQPARLALLLIYRGDRQGLRLHLAGKLLNALADQPRTDAVTLAVRFLGWLPGSPGAGADATGRQPPRSAG
ncbi:flavin reductase [Plantactinospora endophytica]